ncbi:SYF2-domain-containing protein [Tricholoma matsutake]|nr:SYF2-domain-containing protein [Tricholoma matsutake 945]
MPVTRSSKRNKKSTDKRTSEIPEVAQEPESGEEVVITEAVEQFVDKMTGIEEAQGGSSPEDNGRREENDDATNGSDAPKLTMEERKAKLAQLRKKIAASAKANRVSLIEESAKAKITVRDAARLDRQRKLAEALRQKADAEERGDDVERHKNWEWTIEENDNWEKKLARKARRADFEFHDDAHAARRRYKKDLDVIKPDLVAYNKQKEVAMGLAPGTLVTFNPTEGSSALVPTSQQQQLAAENLYRDANTLIYGDSKPSEEAIDRLVSKINQDIDKKSKFSRKRPNEDEGDITYINEHNRVFNKKIARYYDKYTAEIRASFERGTAL